MSVPKTYKMFVGGAFIRSERGYVQAQNDRNDEFVANYPLASRKDVRNAVVSARKAREGWASRTAFNRGQILFRLAEMLESRKDVFARLLHQCTTRSKEACSEEVREGLDTVFYFAGWADKYAQVVSSVNPVAAPYFNFSTPEPMGVVGLFPPTDAPFAGFLSALMPVVLSGNTLVILVDGDVPLVSLEIAEAIATSDFPAGVINILTGARDELLPHLAHHLDVNAIAAWGLPDELRTDLEIAAADNMKRVAVYSHNSPDFFTSGKDRSLYRIVKFVETKTAWHPIGW